MFPTRYLELVDSSFCFNVITPTDDIQRFCGCLQGEFNWEVSNQERISLSQSWSGAEPRRHIKLVPRPVSRWSFDVTTWTALRPYYEVPVHVLEYGRTFFTCFIRFGVSMWTFLATFLLKRLWFKRHALLSSRGCNQTVSNFFSFLCYFCLVAHVSFDSICQLFNSYAYPK